MYVIIVWDENSVGDFEGVVGPFDTEDEALNYARSHD